MSDMSELWLIPPFYMLAGAIWWLMSNAVEVLFRGSRWLDRQGPKTLGGFAFTLIAWPVIAAIYVVLLPSVEVEHGRPDWSITDQWTAYASELRAAKP